MDCPKCQKPLEENLDYKPVLDISSMLIAGFITMGSLPTSTIAKILRYECSGCSYSKEERKY